MPRQHRASRGQMIYHCLNRENRRKHLFFKPADYDAFLRVLAEARERVEMDVLANRFPCRTTGVF